MKSQRVNFIPLLKKLPGLYPTWTQTILIILLFCSVYYYVTEIRVVKRPKTRIRLIKLKEEYLQLSNAMKFDFPDHDIQTGSLVAVSKFNISKNISFSTQLDKITSYLKPGIWLQALLLDYKYNFTRIQGMAVSTQGLSQFYKTIISKNEIIGLPFKVVFLGKITDRAVKIKLAKQNTLLSSVSDLGNAVSRFRNRAPATEKRLQQIPFLFQTNQLSARFSESMKYKKRR